MDEENRTSIVPSTLFTIAGHVFSIAAMFLPILSTGTEKANIMGMMSLFSDAASAAEDTERIVFLIGAAIFALPVFFTALTLLFTFLRLPAPVLVFDMFSAVSLMILILNYDDKYKINGAAAGPARYVMLAGIIIIFIGSIWMKSAKKKIKAEEKAQQQMLY